MRTINKIGIAMIFLGVIMFVVGFFMFTYRGDYSKFMFVAGEVSFAAWFPTVLIGGILYKTKKRKK